MYLCSARIPCILQPCSPYPLTHTHTPLTHTYPSHTHPLPSTLTYTLYPLPSHTHTHTYTPSPLTHTLYPLPSQLHLAISKASWRKCSSSRTYRRHLTPQMSHSQVGSSLYICYYVLLAPPAALQPLSPHTHTPLPPTHTHIRTHTHTHIYIPLTPSTLSPHSHTHTHSQFYRLEHRIGSIGLVRGIAR
jgi:hypothetical protein